MRITVYLLATLMIASSTLLAAPAAPAASSESAPEALHKSATDPVEVKLAATSAPVVGVPFTLRATLTATWQDLPATKVVLALPEELVTDGPTRVFVDLVEGQPALVEFSLTPTLAGTHALTLTARAPVAEDSWLGGARTGFVVVPEVGLGAFHEDALPRATPWTTTTLASPPEGLGAFVAVVPDEEAGATPDAQPVLALPDEAPHKALESGGEASEGDGAVGALSHSTFQVHVCWYYENEASPAVDTPQRFATVQVIDEDDFFDDTLSQGITGDDGCYTSPALPREDSDGGSGNQDVFVRIHLCNAWVCVEDADEDWYVFRVNYGTVGDEDLIDLGGRKPGDAADNFGTRAFQYANNAAYFATNHLQAPSFSGSGPQVTVWAPSQDGNCPGMFLRRSEDRIHVCSGSDRSPDDVGHEMGHWTHWNMYGQSFWPSPGGPHNLCTDSQDRGLSWAEGWGNFFGPRAGLEVIAPSADNNINYDRPWDGSSFSINMEGVACSQVGDDNEMRVAQALWDIRDTSNDGFDTGSASGPFIAAVIGACDDNNFRDYFDGGGCSWITQGGDACTFMRAAAQNNIDFDDNAPTAGMTSQGAFSWVRDTLAVSASAADADTGCVPSVDFRISHDSACNGSDTAIGVDTSSPYTGTFDTNAFSDDGSVWTCARSSDGIETSGWSTSAQFGVDNTPPSVTTSIDGTLGNDGWWTSAVSVSLPCTDALSGVDGVWYWLDGAGVTTYTGPFPVSGEGIHTLSFECSDNAGNLDAGFATIKIDTLAPATAPTVSGPPGEHGWWIGDVTIELACADPVPGSGCLGTQVEVTPPGGSSAIFDYVGPFILTGDGVHTVAFHSVDVAGNVEPTQSFVVKIDTMPPTGEITGATDGAFSYAGAYVLGGLFTNAPTLTVSYHSADAASGLQFVSVAGGGEVDAYAGELDVTGTLTLALPEGISTWTILAEDMAGHVAPIGTFQVVRVTPGLVVDPKTSGWWKGAVKPSGYTQAQLDAFLPLIGVGSHSFGAPDGRYGDITAANYATYLQNAPSSADERVRKELAAAWLNLASGREPTAKAMDLRGASGWRSVVTNTGGSSATTALNVILQVEQRLRESPSDAMLTDIRSVLATWNTGTMNT